MMVTLPNKDKPSNPIGWSSFGFHLIFHESYVLWFALDHARSEFLTFLLQCTAFLLAPIHKALVFEIFIFKPEHFSELCSIWMKIYTEDMFANVAVISSAYRSVFIPSLSVFMPSVCSFVLRDMANISTATTNK